MPTSLLTRPSGDGSLADLGRSAFSGAQSGAPGTRVAHGFRQAGAEGLAADEAQPRLAPAHADGQLGRTGTAAPFCREETLHDAVLERVVADDHEAPTWAQEPERTGQATLDRIELPVDGDAERLEDARRGMD